MAKRFSKYFGKKNKNYVLPAGPNGRRSGKAWSTWKDDVKTQVGEVNTGAEQKTINIPECDRRQVQSVRQSE